jgi:hypothetical protein
MTLPGMDPPRVTRGGRRCPVHFRLLKVGLCSNSRSLALLAAIRRASSRRKVAKPAEIVAPDRAISRGQGP